MPTITQNLYQIQQQIASTLLASQRPLDPVQLLCVTKGRDVDQVSELIAAGQTRLAENCLQEALPKITALQHHNLEWHFIGRIQNNKTRKIAEHFSWVDSIASFKTAQRLSTQRPKNMAPLNICVQVNIDRDPTKGGISPQETFPLVQSIAPLPQLRLRGLMTILKQNAAPTEQLASFQRLHSCFIDLQKNGFAVDTLSMGMSDDFRLAIQAGATIVRIGSALFQGASVYL